jgi:hypothetical protein
MANRKAIRTKARKKRDGYVVKGITPPHWWQLGDYDKRASSRQYLKRDVVKQLREAA